MFLRAGSAVTATVYHTGQNRFFCKRCCTKGTADQSPGQGSVVPVTGCSSLSGSNGSTSISVHKLQTAIMQY